MATAFALTGSVRELGASGVPALDPITAKPGVTAQIRYRQGAVPTDSASGPPGIARMVVNTVAAFAFTLMCALLAFSFLPMVVGYRPVVVTSNSMEPSLQRSDVVVLAPTPREKLAEGTVINFGTPDGDVIHRVVDVTAAGYRTRGDANTSTDSTPVPAGNVNGVGAFLVPLVGQPALWFDNGDWLELVTTVALVTMSGRIGRRKWLSRAPAPGTRVRRSDRNSLRAGHRLAAEDG